MRASDDHRNDMPVPPAGEVATASEPPAEAVSAETVSTEAMPTEEAATETASAEEAAVHAEEPVDVARLSNAEGEPNHASVPGGEARDTSGAVSESEAGAAGDSDSIVAGEVGLEIESGAEATAGRETTSATTDSMVDTAESGSAPAETPIPVPIMLDTAVFGSAPAEAPIPIPMMVSPARLPSRSAARRSRRAAEYDERAGDLAAILRTSSTRLDPKLVSVGLADLEVVRGRLALGVDSTVVAFIGGTGSGKSSLFNAISGVQFADVGVRRPTTSQVTACFWGLPVEPLLDWLEVLPQRRHERESILDADDEFDMHGLVLLDLPDHDSIVDTNRFEVDRILPKVDLLVWVVDPQKYADQAIHAGYLQELVGHEGSMLVLLNQVDTLKPEAVEPVVRDIERLLQEDGLSEVPVLAVSAKTGFGLAGVRERFAKVVSRGSKSAERADAALTLAATRLSEGLGASVVTRGDLPISETNSELRAAAGVDQLAEAAGMQRRYGVERSPTPPVHVQADRVERARSAMIDAGGHGLPIYWLEYLDVVVAKAGSIAQDLADAIVNDLVPVRRSRWRVFLGIVAAILAAITFAAAAWWALIAGGVLSGAPRIGTLVADYVGVGSELPVVIAAAALVASGGVWWLRYGVGRASERAAAQSRLRRLDDIVAAAVESNLVAPIEAVLTEHEEMRERLAAIAGIQISGLVAWSADHGDGKSRE